MERKDLIHYTYEEYKKGSFTTGNIQLNIRLRQRRKHRKIVKTVKWKYSNSHKISLGMSHERKKHKGKNKEQVQQSVTKTPDRFFIHAKLNEDATGCLQLNIGGERHINIDNQEIEKCVETSDFDQMMPIYMHIPSKKAQLVHLHLKTFDSCRSVISEAIDIPGDKFYLTFYGRVLHPGIFRNIQPYDSLGVHVKGKGGMFDLPILISKESTDETTLVWLKKEVGFTDEELTKFDKFRFLDGDTLFAYNDVREFSVDLKIPIGLSRRIFLLRDKNEKLQKLLNFDIAKWSVSEVQNFIQSAAVNSPEIEEICNIVKQKYIDGLVFLSYASSTEMQEDLDTTRDSGIIFKRIIAKRDRLLSSQEEKLKSMVNDSNIGSENTSPAARSSQENLKTFNKTLSSNTEISKDWVAYIKNVLCLMPCEIKTADDEDHKKCKLSIIHSGWSNRNLLEKKLIFFVVSCEDDFPAGGACLWRRIRKHLPTWHTYFTPVDRELFKVSSQKDDVLMYNKNSFTLSNKNVVMRYLMEKTLNELLSSDNVFLIVSKNVYHKDTKAYLTYLEQPRKRTGLKLSFTFIPDKKYWVFNPDDLDFGFQLEYIPVHDCHTTTTDVKLESPESTNTQHFSNTSKNNVDAESQFSDQAEKQIVSNNRIEIPNIQSQRNFKGDATDIQYVEGWRLATAEHDGSVSFQCFEFKFVPDSLLDKGSPKVSSFMNKEIIRFACGCLNSRKNGTIMFGVADSQDSTETQNTYVHGEIVGIPVDSIKGDFRANFTETLRTAISKCFEDHCYRIAAKCIGNPVFVKVVTILPSCPKFVIEIDVEPSSVYCEHIFFKINRSKILSAKDVEKEFTLYVREDTGTSKKTNLDETLFIKTELNENIRKRVEDEKQMIPGYYCEPIEPPMDKLRRLLCRGSNKFDSSIWPILVLNKPTQDQKGNEQWLRWLKFIKLVDFLAVFDFDDESNYNGLCSMYRNKENSILQDEEIFFEYAGNKSDLADKLGMPHDTKKVWLFSNGRFDIQPKKPPLSGEKWTNTYSAGIRDAVIFYSQKDIIPKGRALVIVLLFSNNFDGLAETFREIAVRFGWEQIVVIATENPLSRFMSESMDMADNIRQCSISGPGMTWEHVNSTFFEITGHQNQGNVILTTSTGALIPADEKFIETLTEFSILSAKQCEEKEFKTTKDEEEFSSEMELKFYRGEKADWFNFYYEDQVLKRHCFDRLKKAVRSILQNTERLNDRDKKTVSTVIIAHEPGAGGTTLARNILWEFHKDYRCAVITKITDRTAKHVLSLWQHKESKHAKPLLLLIDELPHSELTFEDLIRHIHIEYRTNPVQDGLVCCFLVCQRENEISDQTIENNPYWNLSGNYVEHLIQKLTKPEIKWMDKKFEKLEQKGAEYQPEHLLSFMILREGFKEEYIKKTIKQFLTLLNIKSNEFELLEYISLVSTYVPTSRRGPNVFIPLECCDDLMNSRVRKIFLWENSMSNTLKMFLIIEPKQTGIGKQIRMAHPTLAKAVLLQILENKKESLSSITQRFFGCLILKSSSHGREMVIDLTKEMLVRRLKEEYNDDKTTPFSPLIVDICKQEMSWINAKNVLEKGFEKIKDSFVAQTLARLCSKYRDFESGIHWANQAINMSIGNKIANGFGHLNLAFVLEELFNHKTKEIYYISPNDAIQHITVILDAFDHFIVASRLRTGSGDHILYPITGVLCTIISCINFIKDKVRFTSNIDLTKLITDKAYLPDELENWKSFKLPFALFSTEGEKAFVIIEQCLCLNTTFYAHDSLSSFPTESREHRLYRNMQYKYPILFNDFRSFFGANSHEMPPQSNIPEVHNNWHRRCLITLGGNSYMNIFNILRQIRDRTEKFNKVDGIKKCIEIKTHLIKITDRTPKDLANLISVNIVLGLLGGEKRDSLKTILEYCKEIVKLRRDYVDIAYFYICLLLWPSSKLDVEYDDDLFNESLMYLQRKKEIKPVRQRDVKYVFLKEEKNKTQPTTQFFLTTRTGFDCLCHRLNIFFREDAASRIDNDMWENCGEKYHLMRLMGQLKFNEGKLSIRLQNEKSTKYPYIEIRKIRTGKTEFLSEEKVYFYLGFSIAGPMAYNVKLTRHEDVSNSVLTSVIQDGNVEQYLKETEESLQSKLDKITDLKSKMKHRTIKQRDQELMKHEQDIRTALDVKRNDIYSTD